MFDPTPVLNRFNGSRPISARVASVETGIRFTDGTSIASAAVKISDNPRCRRSHRLQPRPTRQIGWAAHDIAGLSRSVDRDAAGRSAVGHGRPVSGFLRCPRPDAAAACILTGAGFFGAGAMFRQNDMLSGVTTAATQWFVTVIGLWWADQSRHRRHDHWRPSNPR